MIVAGRRWDHPETQVDDVEDYDYNNQADRDAYCPDIEDNNDAYGRSRCGRLSLLAFYLNFWARLQ
jgi:hypothetical protein